MKKVTVALHPANPGSAGFSPERLNRIDVNISDWLADGRLNGPWP